MDRATLAVQYVFMFTLAAGIVVLLAAVQSTRDERRYESAMLRTLGASRATVLQGVAAEFSALDFYPEHCACGATASAGFWHAACSRSNTPSIPQCGRPAWCAARYWWD